MKKIYKVENVKCEGCANTLKTKLKDEFGEVEVNLEVMPREITLDIENENESKLRDSLKTLGYPMSDEVLNLFQSTTTKAKSFVSCAVGKMDTK